MANSRNTFTHSEKAKAVKLLAAGTHTLKQVAEKFGCSVAALQLWKKALKRDIPEEGEETPSPAESVTTTYSHAPHRTSGKHEVATDEIIRKFWNDKYRAVDMLLEPKSISADDAVKLVNEALKFACDHQ